MGEGTVSAVPGEQGIDGQCNCAVCVVNGIHYLRRGDAGHYIIIACLPTEEPVALIVCAVFRDTAERGSGDIQECLHSGFKFSLGNQVQLRTGGLLVIAF